MLTTNYAARIVLALSLGLLTSAVSGADDSNRLYVTVDKAQVLAFRSATLSKVAVTNPAVADVHVISPTQMLINGKTPGTTSLLVFHADRVDHFDVVVHPAPMIPSRAPLVPSDEHAVEVLRAGKVQQQLFVRDTEQAWVQLGTPIIEVPEVTKK